MKSGTSLLCLQYLVSNITDRKRFTVSNLQNYRAAHKYGPKFIQLLTCILFSCSNTKNCFALKTRMRNNVILVFIHYSTERIPSIDVNIYLLLSFRPNCVHFITLCRCGIYLKLHENILFLIFFSFRNKQNIYEFEINMHFSRAKLMNLKMNVYFVITQRLTYFDTKLHDITILQ